MFSQVNPILENSLTVTYVFADNSYNTLHNISLFEIKHKHKKHTSGLRPVQLFITIPNHLVSHFYLYIQKHLKYYLHPSKQRTPVYTLNVIY